MRRRSSGFTLIEVLVALVVGTLVFLCLSSVFGQAVGRFDREREIGGTTAFDLQERLRMQLLHCVMVDEDGFRRVFWFDGDRGVLTFATNCSVQGISGGAPSLVRYYYDPRKRVLQYAEWPLGGKSPEEYDRFVVADPSDHAWSWVRIPMETFELSYLADQQGEELQPRWPGGSGLPVAVVFTARGRRGRERVAIYPGSFNLTQEREP